MISSSMIVDGLSWWQSWLCVWIGYTVAAIFVYILGRIATIYRIPFAVANRASFGIWGSFWPIINRAAMAVIWYGVQVRKLSPRMRSLLTFPKPKSYLGGHLYYLNLKMNQLIVKTFR
jgi:cytosine/uracil/thiamine/allantoin permease